MAVMMQFAEKFRPTFYKNPQFYYRAYNLGVTAFRTYQFMTDPAASAFELVPEIMIHGMEATFPNSMNEIMAYANIYRFTHAGFGLYTKISSISEYGNFLDMHFHGINLLHRLSNVLDEDDNRLIEQKNAKEKVNENLHFPRNLLTQFGRGLLGRKAPITSLQNANTQKEDSTQTDKQKQKIH